MNGGSGGYVGESPSCFQLQLGVFLLLHVLDHSGNEASVDDCLDGRGVSYGKDLSNSDHSVMLSHDVGVGNCGNEVAKHFDAVVGSQEAEWRRSYL